MTFDETLAQVIELLQREGRVSYRALKIRFNLDDEYLEGLKDELIMAKRLAVDEDGKVLVWVGEGEKGKGEKGETGKRSEEKQSIQTLDSRLTDPRLAAGERRQLTVMFCDLVGSTALSTQLDPEELREVILAYQEACAQEIRRVEGYLARYVGDGLLVYFSYPQAHEDDARRAVQAGLGIVATLPHLNSRLQQTVEAIHEFPLRVRIGIHTGLVVISDMGGGGYRDPMAIVGETPNVAARLQGLAEPDTVVISQATHRLIQGYFQCQDLGLQTLKGISTPLPVYRVLHESEAHSRFEVAVRTGLTPLVGRDEELGLLLRRWEKVKESEGQVVLLSGEAGIGKSRLVQELKEHVAREGYTRIEFRCSPYYQNTAFYPVIEHIQRLLQFRREDSPQEKLDKLEGMLREYRLPLQEVVPLFAVLLSLPHPDHYPPLSPIPQKQKQKMQEALVAWLVAEAERSPLLAAWEDLHWADPSTLELHSLFLDQAPTARILTLLTCRPEFSPPWGTRSYQTQITLSRLSSKQVEEMVERITGRKTLPAEVLQQVVTKTDGVPLFVEELTKTVLESGLLKEADGHYELIGLLPPLAIPSTLHDSLMARLDRLATVREVVQLGATLGREFTYEVLQAVSPLNELTLQSELTRLVEAELLYQRGLPPQARYVFKHALIQDAAYQSLLKSKRQQYHQQIAQVLEEQFPETKETQPELLAHHYTEAGLIAQALPYWQQAGQKAAERPANAEAVSHFTTALRLLKSIPDTLERIRQELTLQIAVGMPLIAVKGHAAPEVEQAYARAQELCQQMGETPQLFNVLIGQFAVSFLRAELQTARGVAEQSLSLARSVQDPARLVGAHLMLGLSLSALGEFALAREHMERSLALYDPAQHRSLAFLYGEDPRVSCLSWMAVALRILGYTDQALERSRQALTLARELSHPSSRAFALDWAALLSTSFWEVRLACELAEEAIALSTEQGFPHWLAYGTIVRGWTLTMQQQGEEGIAQIRQGLSAYRAIGAETGLPYFLALLAEAHGKVGQAEEGLSVVAEALTAVDKTGERFSEAELYRLKGQLTLQRFQVSSSKFQVPSTQPRTPNPQAEAEAEACFLKAIEIARRQQAKSLELRAVMSLSRLWQQQGKKEEAQQMLAEIYGWFTEGFDTADLKEAKALLEELL